MLTLAEMYRRAQLRRRATGSNDRALTRAASGVSGLYLCINASGNPTRRPPQPAFEVFQRVWLDVS